MATVDRANLRRDVTMVALLAALLLIAGCTGIGKSRSAEAPIYYGTEGIMATFAPEGVDVKIPSGVSAEFPVLLTNKGAVDSSTVIVSLRDTLGAFEFTPNVIMETDAIMPKLPGKESNQIGSIELVSIGAKALEFGKDQDETKTGLVVTTCYTYKTKLDANVCIDTTGRTFQKQRKACDDQKPITLKSQGAPVAIKKIETYTPKVEGFARPSFKIYVSNVGSGRIVVPSALKAYCTADKNTKLRAQDLDVVFVTEVMLNDKPLKCSDDDETTGVTKELSGKAASDYVYCEYPYADFGEGTGTFATPLRVELSYGYAVASNPLPILVEKGFERVSDTEEAPPHIIPLTPRGLARTPKEICDDHGGSFGGIWDAKSGKCVCNQGLEWQPGTGCVVDDNPVI